MSVSKAVREALKKGKKRQGDLADLWETSPQVVCNKFRLERWSAKDIVQVAAFTGGKLVFVYPDSQQIPIESAAVLREPEAAVKAEENALAQGKQKAEPAKKTPAKPKQKKAPAAPKKAEPKKTKAPAEPELADTLQEPEEPAEQLSIFDL